MALLTAELLDDARVQPTSIYIYNDLHHFADLLLCLPKYSKMVSLRTRCDDAGTI